MKGQIVSSSYWFPLSLFLLKSVRNPHIVRTSCACTQNRKLRILPKSEVSAHAPKLEVGAHLSMHLSVHQSAHRVQMHPKLEVGVRTDVHSNAPDLGFGAHHNF
jgi:hypothetical protein